jgi:hypothetical protein
MKQRSFLFWNIASGIAWALFHVGLGYFSGNIVAVLIRKWSHKLGWILLAVIIIALAYWLIKRQGRKFPLYFQTQSRLFMEKLLSGRWFTALDEKYPVVSEFSHANTVQEELFSLFLIALILIFLYVLALIL